MRGTLNTYVLILNCMLICFHFRKGAGAKQGPIVETDYGKVEGSLTEHARVFKGIPFGESISGPNRWKDAVSPEAWSPGILDATNDPPACPQDCSGTCPNQDEECLFLDVYTPLDASNGTNYPVLVFIHGGGYTIGYSSFVDGNYLVSSSDIIIVSIQYRLGALGFLVFGSSVGDPAIKGNFGIKDQILALQWVQDNIHAFGGNKDDVTLSGQSAGAMSVAIHMTRENHEELFHKAIVQSDPFGINYMTVDDAEAIGDELSLKLECDTVECMRNKDYEEILTAQGEITIPTIALADLVLPWAPVIDADGDLLTEQPLESFRSGHTVEVPTIMGTTGAEGINFVYTLLLSLGFSGPLPKGLYQGILLLMFGWNMDHYQTVYGLYPGSDDSDYDHGLLLSEILTDYQYYCPTVLAAQGSSSADNPVYSYIFDQPVNKTWGVPEIEDLCVVYACHGAEMPFVFRYLHNFQTPQEKRLAHTVSNYWGRFVNTGNPNPPQDEEEKSVTETTDWPSNPDPINFIDLKMIAPNPEVVYNDRQEKCDALNEIGYGLNLMRALYKAANHPASMLQQFVTSQE